MSRKQYRFLKKIKKSGVYDYKDLSKEDMEIIKFMYDHSYITYVDDREDDDIRSKLHLCRITQEGESALYEWKAVRDYRYIPMATAIFAAIGGYRGELALIGQAIAKLWKLLTAG